MGERIFDTSYWQERLENANNFGELHRSIFLCPKSEWEKIEERHKEILRDLIKPTDSVLDVGCGYGRLLTLMPETWKGLYLGIDISVDFLMQARRNYPHQAFELMDARDLHRIQPVNEGYKFHWAILISIRPMVINNMGSEVWEQMEAEIRKKAHKILYLEYTADDKGVVE